MASESSAQDLDTLLSVYLSRPGNVDCPNAIVLLDNLWLKNPHYIPKKSLREKIRYYPGCGFLKSRLRQAKRLRDAPELLQPSLFARTGPDEESRIRQFLEARNVKNTDDIFTLEPLESLPLVALHVIQCEKTGAGHCFYLPYLMRHLELRNTNPITNVDLTPMQKCEVDRAIKSLRGQVRRRSVTLC